jgi:hypothetical protein
MYGTVLLAAGRAYRPLAPDLVGLTVECEIVSNRLGGENCESAGPEGPALCKFVFSYAAWYSAFLV